MFDGDCRPKLVVSYISVELVEGNGTQILLSRYIPMRLLGRKSVNRPIIGRHYGTSQIDPVV